MSQKKQRKRRSKALPVLGAAGLSLSLASSASAVLGGPAVNLPTSSDGDGNQVFLGEEEIADVSLATFYVFDKEDVGAASGSSVELVRPAVMAAMAAAVITVGIGVVEGAITAVAVTAAAVGGGAAAEAAAASGLGLGGGGGVVAAGVAAVVAAGAEVVGDGATAIGTRAVSDWKHLALAEQPWQLGNVRCYTPSFIKRHGLGDFSIALVGVAIEGSRTAPLGQQALVSAR
jgi:hypothetical protein